MSNFSHLDSTGNPRMVNVGNKNITARVAKASAKVYLPENVMIHFTGKDIDTKKGSVFQSAILAGVMEAKKTSELIPLCHPLPLDHCDIQLEIVNKNELLITAETAVEARTGVEMEALTAVSIAALTVYDMCKGLSHDIEIRDIKLLSKSGGKSNFARNE